RRGRAAVEAHSVRGARGKLGGKVETDPGRAGHARGTVYGDAFGKVYCRIGDERFAGIGDARVRGSRVRHAGVRRARVRYSGVLLLAVNSPVFAIAPRGQRERRHTQAKLQLVSSRAPRPAPMSCQRSSERTLRKRYPSCWG